MPPQLLLLLLTPRPGYELGKQSSKLKKNTLLFLKAAYRWRQEVQEAQSAHQRQEAAANLVTADTVGFEAYLERQGRNEFLNLASQIACDGTNIAFVFYENQIRKLMSESPCDERRLEVLRAYCIGQPREMVNPFIAPMRCMSTAQQIKKALARLRQRFGVSGGLTTEPKIIDIRLGPRVVFNTASLKSYNEDLNTSEVFAYAHDEVEKLSGQLLMNVVNCLPGVLKRRYLDYL